MTIRDLSPRQLYNLRRRCGKEQRELNRATIKRGFRPINEAEKALWNVAFNKGLKAGLELR